jgi:tight adherence protein C
MDAASIVLTLAALAAGASVALALAWLGRRVQALPPEDRRWRDRPPVGIRMVWWPVRLVAASLASRLPQRVAHRLEARLRAAGLDFALTPAEFVAARVVWAAVAAGAGVGATLLLPPRLAADGAPALVLGAAVLGAALPAAWLRDCMARRRAELARHLPFVLDLVTLCVEAGLNLQGALAQAVAKGPRGALRDELQRCLRDIRAGKARAAALRDLAARVDDPALTRAVDAIVQAESLGSALGPVLRIQSDQCRSDRFLRAERLAMQAPVKMLLPLIGFIFPCTFVVLLFPVAVRLLQGGF